MTNLIHILEKLLFEVNNSIRDNMISISLKIYENMICIL